MKTGRNILGALNYNENKVSSGRAECILANMFGMEHQELSFNAKKTRFQDQVNLNRISKTNVLHISLNFATGEQVSTETLRAISNAYMEGIGFSGQPYLVYNHFDAGHPHIHIVTTSIQDDGTRIPLHNIGKHQSEKARKEIEILFNLVKAQDQEVRKHPLYDLSELKKASYGTVPTREAIAKIVRTITRTYKFTSIPELNAVLQQYNVQADRGKEGTIMNAKKGLVYHLLDGQGNKVGVPIKASSIYGKPSLANLEKQFKLNEALRKPHKARIQKSIQHALSTAPHTVTEFIKALEKHNIIPVFRQNEAGRVYGVTFIDNGARVVFNGSDLGKEFSANAIAAKLTDSADHKSIRTVLPRSTPAKVDERTGNPYPSTGSSMEQVLKNLLSPEGGHQAIEPALTKKRKKKRKGRSI